MKVGGYDRGGITYIIVPRLISLMTAVQSGKLDGLSTSIHNNDETAFVKNKRQRIDSPNRLDAAQKTRNVKDGII